MASPAADATIGKEWGADSGVFSVTAFSLRAEWLVGRYAGTGFSTAQVRGLWLGWFLAPNNGIDQRARSRVLKVPRVWLARPVIPTVRSSQQSIN